jgi:hypothetical protein
MKQAQAFRNTRAVIDEMAGLYYGAAARVIVAEHSDASTPAQQQLLVLDRCIDGLLGHMSKGTVSAERLGASAVTSLLRAIQRHHGNDMVRKVARTIRSHPMQETT